MDTPWLYQIGALGLFGAFLALMLVTALIGHAIGSRQRRRSKSPDAYSLKGLDTAVLGLLALLIGFTMSVALARYDERRIANLNEANAIGTAWLRSQLLPEPFRGETDRLMRNYVQLRLDLIAHRGTEAQVEQRIQQSSALQTAIWDQAKGAAKVEPGMVPTGIYINALNDMIDQQEVRLSAIRNHIPGEAFLLLVAVAAVVSLFGSYSMALERSHRSLAEAITQLLIVCVIMTIFDLDDSNAGFIHVSVQPFYDLAGSMGIPLP